ncbi:MAG: class I mannose-6-phosphate isomerase [Lachnospiraceae bacterium]|nr:class I mannose-6-phosphate isomerase [Lachnospiraceae bacterium]
MNKKPVPLRLKPAGKGYIWGGERLKKEYNKADLDVTPLAESWECSVHPDGMSIVAGGEYDGLTLKDVISSNPQFLGSKSDAMPILIKFIDAAADLSIQVHPDDEYARSHEGDNGKTEFWYVLDAEEGAELIYGFEHPMNREKLREAIDEGRLEGMVHHIPVHKGDVFFVHPGTVHAIGKGIVIVEVQESSNLTYRLYDYNRTDKDGNKRPLHFDKAAEVLDMKPVKLIRQPQHMVRYYFGCARELLCRCEYFEVERVQVTKGFSFSVLDTSFQVLLCIDGNGGLETDESNKPVRFDKGACIFLPASLGRCHVIGECTLLKVRC